jgi:ABC-type transporter Mla subunit MlaD
VSIPESGISLHVVYARNDNARRVVAGLAAATAALAEIWQQLDRALDDVPALGAIIARLVADLAGTRMDRANLIAAIRATLAAHADGEADPLSYLRDQLAEITGRGDAA